MNHFRGQRVCTAKVTRLLLVCCAFFSCCDNADAASDTLLPFGTHSWRYTDSGSLPAANWFARSYPATGWKNNFGQFGYGEGDETTLIGFGPDPQMKFVTTYFRSTFTVADTAAYTSVSFCLLRDAGAVVYLNGAELFRENMPGVPETIGNNTYALSCLSEPEENTVVTNSYPAALLRNGLNYLAVEIHQCSPTSADLSFDLSVLGESEAGSSSVIRGPYLQVGTSSNIIVRWRTSIPTTSRVEYGTNEGNLDQAIVNFGFTNEHEILLPNLSAATKYFYNVGTATQVIEGDSSYFFVTAPTPGSTPPVRIWAIGDFGTGYGAQDEVRDAY
ncbi:MAG TPA: fibronectin type III domain-containing protein, partial [Candidatus Acidoferrum sp.]|nr:fibronectin type III domain-containing protein [Candidatus Acidoferrum sp.]